MEQEYDRQLLAGMGIPNYDLVFCRPDGRTLDPSGVSRRFKALATRVGYRGLRFHDLRHSHATILLAQGVHPKVVQERLGYNTISITLDTYSHGLPGLQEAAAEKLGALLNRNGTCLAPLKQKRPRS